MWRVDLDGNLSAEGRNELMRYVDELIVQIVTQLQALEASLSVRGTDATFEALNRIVQDSGRLGAYLRPLRAGTGEVRRLRDARRAFCDEVFGDLELSTVLQREPRNSLEHFDERREEAAIAAGPAHGLISKFVGPADAIEVVGSSAPVWTLHFDPEPGDYFVFGHHVNIRMLRHEILQIRERLREWIAANPHRR